LNIFVINTGSTSTKLAYFQDGKVVALREHQHPREELARLGRVINQIDFRMEVIRDAIAKSGIDVSFMDAVAGRGGLLHPLDGGVYEVSDDMLNDLHTARYGEHACNLGAVLAHELAQEWSVPAFIVDPVVTDELEDVARLTGLPGIERRSLFHALNQRGAARTVAARLGVEYEVSNFIVCHMGGGISIGAHRLGRVVDVTNALDGEGPFSPERTGDLPVIPVLEMISRGETTPEQLKNVILRGGGLFAHMGSNDLRETVARMESGQDRARLVFEALAYNIAKHVASMIPALVDGKGLFAVAAVVLTGGMAQSSVLIEEITRLIRYVGPVEVVVGEEEMAALAHGAERVLSGIESAHHYHAICESR
jgi:butyrate kinase